jgi:putative ABC transport system permease protein
VPAPPSFVERLVALTIRDPMTRDMVLGDLHEEYIRRSSQRPATRWYCRQAVSIAAHALARRDRTGVPSGHSGDIFMRMLAKDIRYGWRSLIQRPLLTLTVAITLGLGLGANAAIFNLIDRMVLRPFPLADPDHTVLLSETGPQIRYHRESASLPNFLDWRNTSTTMTSLSALQWWDANLVDRGDPERLQGFQVSFAFFDALGIRPALGRAFVKDDETFGRHRVAVLSDALWKRRFGASPSIVGRRITIDGDPYEVIGVAPPRFAFPDGSEVWAPLSFDPTRPPRRDAGYLTVVGRLQPGKTLEDAQAEMSVIADRLARQYPETNRDHGVRIYTLTRGMMDEGTGPILSLWQASALIVLLIACANIANLMLARAAERRREIAVRLALGASRARVVREMLVESALLALMAVPPALAFAWISLHALRVSMPPRILRFVPGFASLGLDARMLAVTVGLALLTAGIFGVMPALQAARANMSAALKEGGRSVTGRQLLRRAIVVAEMSIALPLLVAAGVGVVGTYKLLNGPQGYDPDGLLTMKLVLPERLYPDDPSRRRFVERAMEALRTVPGVEHAAIINNAPASGSNSTRPIEIDGHPTPDPRNPPTVDNHVATEAYFDTVRLPMLRGRNFTSADREGSAWVAIVSESMAKKYWPGEDPIGRRLKIPNGPWITVVGICGDIIQDWFDRRNVPTMYRPIAQAPSDYFAVVVRTAGDATAAADPVRKALLTVDPTQPVFELMTMRLQIHERTIGLQYLASVMAVCAALALVLAVVGLYAVMAYLVAQRRHEIGVRMALGASPLHVVRLTVGQAARLTAIGAAIGLALSVALGRLMQAGLVGISSNENGVTFFFAAILIGCALLAGYLPARRAAAIDPLVALRTE